MRNIILFDDDNWEGLLPLTFTKPICELRVGILTIREKWEKRLDARSSHITQDYLANKYPIHITEDNLLINSTLLPTDELILAIDDLKPNEALLHNDELLVARLPMEEFDRLQNDQAINELLGKDISATSDFFTSILRPQDIFRHNDAEIRKDFKLLTEGRKSASISSTNQVGNLDNIFVEEGASIEFSILNAADGPIYVGKNATILEGSMIKGPIAICDHSVVKMGAKLYGGTTIGPHSKAGGEITNSVLSGYSNKGHDGYLGNSVLGEWCNLGADTNVSNLKNNYEEVKIWNYQSERFEKTGLQFCGLIMGDHSKSAIGTMFNTGTVVGVSCNIFGSGFPRNFIPSYSWGGHSGFKTYQTDKALKTAEKVLTRRNLTLSEEEKTILLHIYYYTANNRRWAKM